MIFEQQQNNKKGALDEDAGTRRAPTPRHNPGAGKVVDRENPGKNGQS